VSVDPSGLAEAGPFPNVDEFDSVLNGAIPATVVALTPPNVTFVVWVRLPPVMVTVFLASVFLAS
jgi:hypothetical protein